MSTNYRTITSGYDNWQIGRRLGGVVRPSRTLRERVRLAWRMLLRGY